MRQAAFLAADIYTTAGTPINCTDMHYYKKLPGYMLGVILFTAACTTAKTGTYTAQMKEAYIYAFKMTYFKKLLAEGFNHSVAVKAVLTADRSGYGEPILSAEDFTATDSIVRTDNVAMMQDSSARKGRVAAGAAGKRVFDDALSKYHSKWLDSLALARYKLYQLSQKENNQLRTSIKVKVLLADIARSFFCSGNMLPPLGYNFPPVLFLPPAALPQLRYWQAGPPCRFISKRTAQVQKTVYGCRL